MPVVNYSSPWPDDAALLNPIKWQGTQNLGAWTDSGYAVTGWLWNSSAIEATVGLRMASGHDGTGLPQTWEDMGVPSGQTVHGLRVTGTHHWYDLDSAATFLYTSIAFFGGSEILHGTVEPSSPTAFDTGYVNLGSISSSSSFRLQLISEVTAPDSIEVNVRYALTDLLFEIYYGACDLTISPPSAAVAPGGTYTFTASGGSTPVTWSTTGGSIDSSGVLTATMTPGSYTVTATSVWDNTCTDTVPVSVGSGGTLPGRSAGELAGHVALTNSGVPVGGSGTLRARSAGVIAHALLTNFLGDAALEVYFAGAPDATDMTTVAYSLPTEFTLSNPQAGHNYILEKDATDLAEWASGRLGFVKFRRAGGAGGYSGDILLGGIEIIYTEKTV